MHLIVSLAMGQHKSKSARGDSELNGLNGTHKPKKANKKLTDDELNELESKTYCESMFMS